MKLINNFLCGPQAASLAEAIAMSRNQDWIGRKAMELITNGTPGSPLVKRMPADQRAGISRRIFCCG